jgi:hypothetical protein
MDPNIVSIVCGTIGIFLFSFTTYCCNKQKGRSRSNAVISNDSRIYNYSDDDDSDNDDDDKNDSNSIETTDSLPDLISLS